MKEKEWFSNFLHDLATDGYSSSKRALVAVCAVCSILLLLPNLVSQSVFYQPEDVVNQDIWAKNDILVEDQNLTQLKKEQLLSELGLIFDYDPQLFQKIELKTAQAFDYLREQDEKLALQREKFAEESTRLGTENFLQQIELQTLQSSLQRWQAYIQFLEKQTKLTPKNETESAFLNQWIQQRAVTQQNIIQLETKINLLKASSQQLQSRLQAREEESTKLSQAQQEDQKQHISAFLKTLELNISSTELPLLSTPFFSQKFQSILTSLLRPLNNTPILQAIDNPNKDTQGRTELINLETSESFFVDEVQNFQNISEIRLQIHQAAQDIVLPPDMAQYSTLLMLLAEQLAEPSLTINKSELERRKEQINSTSPVYASFKKGENIARRGEVLDPTSAQIINSYLIDISENNQFPKILGIIFLVGGLFAILYLMLGLEQKSTQYKNWTLCVLAISLALLAAKIQLWLLHNINPPWQLASYYSLPILFSALLTGVLINQRVALYSGIVFSIFLTLLIGNDWAFFCYALLGNFVAVLFLGKNISRLDLLKQSFQISLLHPVIVGVILLINNQALDAWFGLALFASLMGGLVSALFVTFLMPLIELCLGFTTNFKLLELSTLNHPALRHLMFKAPGSYHHSVIVSNLAEAAALKIGANSLLVRVGAYYHDIGKSEFPQFFIENNETDCQDAHGQLNAPQASAQLIINHVQIGVEKAKKYKLGKAIEDIILEHHGTTQVEYFLHAAHKKAEKQGPAVDTQDFCYTGPRPSSIESAIVMLADTCEASTRSIANPNRRKIQEMVSRVSQKLLDSGQLDESGISLKEFKQITTSFVGIIAAVHHPRIPYPKAQVLKPKRPWQLIKN